MESQTQYRKMGNLTNYFRLSWIISIESGQNCRFGLFKCFIFNVQIEVKPSTKFNSVKFVYFIELRISPHDFRIETIENWNNNTSNFVVYENWKHYLFHPKIYKKKKWDKDDENDNDIDFGGALVNIITHVFCLAIVMLWRWTGFIFVATLW